MNDKNFINGMSRGSSIIIAPMLAGTESPNVKVS